MAGSKFQLMGLDVMLYEFETRMGYIGISRSDWATVRRRLNKKGNVVIENPHCLEFGANSSSANSWGGGGI